ncbi:MAG: tRNA-uridine aminocarboxypropyltransferase [Polyangiaceae bacterium]
MPIRGSKVVRCHGCGLHPEDCLCDTLEPVAVAAASVVIFAHDLDAARPSNTGRLVARLVQGSELLLHGANRASARWRPEPGRRVLSLHPDGRLLTPEDREGRPYLLVADGTWRQARRMAQRIPALRDAEPVRVEPGREVPVLRQPTQPGLLCTLEAVARALGILESRAVEEQLLAALDEVVARALARRRPRVVTP